MDPSKMLSCKQAAALLGFTVKHVRHLGATGALACSETPIGRLYTREAIESYRENRRSRWERNVLRDVR